MERGVRGRYDQDTLYTQMKISKNTFLKKSISKELGSHYVIRG